MYLQYLSFLVLYKNSKLFVFTNFRGNCRHRCLGEVGAGSRGLLHHGQVRCRYCRWSAGAGLGDRLVHRMRLLALKEAELLLLSGDGLRLSGG